MNCSGGTVALLIKTDDIRDLLSPNEIVTAVEDGYRKWAQEKAYNHPRQSLQAGATRLRLISGALPDLGVLGVRVHADYITTKDGIKQPQVVVLYDYERRGLLAIFVGEGYLLHYPPATSAVGANFMARKSSAVLGVFGTGGTAADFVKLFQVVRPLKKVKVYARDRDRLNRFCRKIEQDNAIETVAVQTPQEAVREVDLLVTATSSNTPVFDGRWLEPGTHISQIVAGNRGEHEAMGLPAKRRELDSETVRRCDVICTNSKEQILVDDQGTIMEPVREGVLNIEKVIELGDVLLGQKQGRNSEDSVTLFYHSGGQGVSDLPIAYLLYEKAKKMGIGKEI
jgi:ornithine cyclodeaminase/alanine dehydrogenase-like protein (mu-crystallin family)